MVVEFITTSAIAWNSAYEIMLKNNNKNIWFMVFNTTFNNITVISWCSVLLVEETTDMSQVTDRLYHIMLYQVHIHLAMSKIQHVSYWCE
jgi:hypothetical protein